MKITKIVSFTKKMKHNLNIQFNRVAFIFFVFFIIYLYLHYSFNSFGFEKSKIDKVDNISVAGVNFIEQIL